MYEMKNGTLFFRDKNGNDVLALDNVDEIALTSNVIEEKDILGNVKNIKKGETTLSFTSTIEKETLFKILGVDISKTPDHIRFQLQNQFKDENIKRKELIKNG